MERENSRIYNSAAVISPKGELLGKYRKIHLFSAGLVREEKCFTPGAHLINIDIDGIKWGLMICYDLRFPELSLQLTLKGTDVLALCASWPRIRINHWKVLTRARAIDNQIFLVGANRTGSDGGLDFGGSSCLIDPFGEVLTEAGENEERLLVAELDKNRVDYARNRLPVMKHRREDLYL